MIKQQLRTNGVLDEKILSLYSKIARHKFTPYKFQEFAYTDMRIPLAHGQQMFSPMEEALLLQELHFNGGESVLEVGTGTGYLTSMLSRLAKNILSIDCFNDFTEHARDNLHQYNCQNVQLLTANAISGWIPKAPYHIMIITGAIESIPDTIKLQLLPGGKLFVILGRDPIMYGKLLTLDHHGQWDEKLLFATNTPKLIDPAAIQEFVF